MRIAFDPSSTRPVFAAFACRVDSSLTLIDVDSQLSQLLGVHHGDHAAEALVDHICPGYASRTYQDVTRQLSYGNDIEIVFPVHCHNGQIRWLLGRAQRCQLDSVTEDCLRGVLVDFTNSKKQYDERKHIAEQYRIILEHTGEVMFEWDLANDSIQFSEGWREKFGYVPRTANFTDVIAKGGNVHKEDITYLLRQLSILRSSRKFLNAEIRIAAGKERWLWCKIQACGIYDTSGALTHVIGLIIDIDDEKKAHWALQAQAEQDSLTKLLNAHTTRQMAEQYLHNGPDNAYCAMLIIDLDDFKRINDQHGHLFGDEVLIRVANILKKSFRNDDIVGRIGGEEFLVLMKNVSDPDRVVERCSHLLEMIRASSTVCKLTVSIGVGIVSGNVTRYEDLFLRTDEALYQAKHAGKDRYILCK